VAARVTRIRLLLAAGLAVAAATVAGCGSDAPAAAPDDAPAAAGSQAPVEEQAGGGSGHNADDVMFLQMMVTHHGQGTKMARLGADKSKEKQLSRLAAAIAATQKDEASAMRSLLEDWDEPAKADEDASVHAAHGGLPATGPEQIEALERMKGGATFDVSFLNLMIGHQGAAAEMAAQELENGENTEVRELARRIVDSRNAQIEMMLGMLNG
jgi:uncharacterized protein (DUF305 family)